MLGDDIAAALPELRAQAESLMVDTLRVEVLTGSAPDPTTLEMTDTYTTVYEGKGRIQRPGNQPAQTVAGEVEFGVGTVYAQLPIDATGIKRNARVTVLAIGGTTDPDLLGVVATVQANLTKTHPTKRTLVCEEVT
jgi:hypothetical protein